MSHPATSDIWAVTAYFNPAGYRRRVSNYAVFRRHLNVPLCTVELAYGPDFELREGDADILIRLRGSDVMWQKERLLNLAIATLPPSCTKVAWLDCDLVFETQDWGERTSALLDRHILVQPFARVLRADRDWLPGDPLPADADAMRSAGCLLESGMSIDEIVPVDAETVKCARGMAWAARRDLLEQRGLYDASIVGGADALIFRAAFGHLDDAVSRQRLGAPREEHYRAWAEPFHGEVRGNVGHTEGDAVHLWHGSLEYRRYVSRFEEFAAFGFDPPNDIALDANGAWRWNSDKPAMHAYLHEYFNSRHEDG